MDAFGEFDAVPGSQLGKEVHLGVEFARLKGIGDREIVHQDVCRGIGELTPEVTSVIAELPPFDFRGGRIDLDQTPERRCGDRHGGHQYPVHRDSSGRTAIYSVNHCHALDTLVIAFAGGHLTRVR